MTPIYIVLERVTKDPPSALNNIVSFFIIALIVSSIVYLNNYLKTRKRKKIREDLISLDISLIATKYGIDEIIRNVKFSEIVSNKEISESFKNYIIQKDKFYLDKIAYDNDNILIITHTVGLAESGGVFHLFFQAKKEQNIIIYANISRAKSELNFYLLDIDLSNYDLVTNKEFVSGLINVLNMDKLIK